MRSRRASPSLRARRCVVLQTPLLARGYVSRAISSVLPRIEISLIILFLFSSRDSKIVGRTSHHPPLPEKRVFSTARVRHGPLFTRFFSPFYTLVPQYALRIVASVAPELDKILLRKRTSTLS